jgi:hypothetical protein
VACTASTPPARTASPLTRPLASAIAEANVIQITRPMNHLCGARVQRGCVIKITAPIDGFLYTCGHAEGNGPLADGKVAMEKNFEISLRDLAWVSGGRNDGGTVTTTISSQGTCTTHTSTNRDGGTTVTVTCTKPEVIK